MELTEGFLVGISSLIIFLSSAVLISANYRRCFPVRTEPDTVVYNVSPKAMQPHEWT